LERQIDAIFSIGAYIERGGCEIFNCLAVGSASEYFDTHLAIQPPVLKNQSTLRSKKVNLLLCSILRRLRRKSNPALRAMMLNASSVFPRDILWERRLLVEKC